MSPKRDNVSRKGILISLSGIDGSGKTTVARLLCREFRDYGLDARYVWLRWKPRRLRLLVDLGRKITVPNARESTLALPDRRRILRRRCLRTGWLFLLALDYISEVLKRAVIPVRRGALVICDRYVLDTAVTVGWDLDLPKEEIPFLLDKLPLSLLPRSDMAFVLDTPVDIAKKRKLDEAEGTYDLTS